MTVRLIPFAPEHLKQLRPRSFEARELLCFGGGLERARDYARLGPAYTGLVDGEILACGGLVLLWRGVAEPWLVTTDLVAARPRDFHLTVRRIFQVLRESMGLHRVQTAIAATHLVSQNWARHLGLKDEGLRPGYGPDGTDYHGFAWVRGGEQCHS